MKAKTEIVETIISLKKKLMFEPRTQFDMGYRLGVKHGLEWVMNQKKIQLIALAKVFPLESEY